MEKESVIPSTRGVPSKYWRRSVLAKSIYFTQPYRLNAATMVEPVNMENHKPLTLLGNKTEYTYQYNPEILETFPNKYPERDFFVKFNAPEFTALCPITGQPDFATLYISYVPDQKMVESKSLKLYLFSFRNHENPVIDI